VYQKSDELFHKKGSMINEVRKQAIAPGKQNFGSKSFIIHRRIFLDSHEAQASNAIVFTNMDDQDYLYSYDLGQLEYDDNSSNSSVDFTPLQSQS
jgi:hypothetical protein